MATHHKCELFIPFRYGRREDPDDPGQRLPVEPEMWTTIESAFKRQFGDWSPMGTTAVEDLSGQWVDPDTKEEVEDVSLYVVVYVEPHKLELFKKLAGAIGKQLEQKEMLIDVADKPSGEFLKVFDGEMTDDEQLLLFGEEQEDTDTIGGEDGDSPKAAGSI